MKYNCALPIIGAFMLSACNDKASDFLITNKSRLTVNNVTVSDNYQKWNLGALPKQSKVRFDNTLQGEGGVVIEWIYLGKQYRQRGCYYTSGAPARGDIFIVNDKLEFGCK